MLDNLSVFIHFKGREMWQRQEEHVRYGFIEIYGTKNSPTTKALLQLLFLYSFPQVAPMRLQRHPRPCLDPPPPAPGVRVWGPSPANSVKEYPGAKFHRDQSRSFDFFREHTNT